MARQSDGRDLHGRDPGNERRNQVDHIELPEDFSGIDADVLTEYQASIREAIQSFGDDVSDEDLGRMETLLAAHESIKTELTARQDRANRAAGIRSQLSAEEVTEIAEEVVEVVEEAELAVETEEAAEEVEVVEVEAEELATSVDVEPEAAEELTVETETQDVESEVEVEAELTSEDAVELSEEAEAVEVEAEVVEETFEVQDASVEDEEPEAVESAEDTSEFSEVDESTEELTEDVTALEGETEVADETVESGLAQHRAAATVVEAAPARRPLRATAYANGYVAGTEIPDPRALAQSIYDARMQFAGALTGERSFMPVARAEAGIPRSLTLSNDQFENFSVLRRASGAEATEALVASGGVCAPFMPSYDIFRVAVPQSPVEDDLPVVAAPRGGIRFIVPPDLQDARAAIGTTTCAEDAAGYVGTTCPAPGPTPNKPCTCVDCPAIQECCVTAVSSCVRFGNLNYRTFPEQVEAFMEDVSVMFASEKEILYLDQINANSTAVAGINTGYGAVRNVVYNLLTAAAGYRQRNWMRRTDTLKVYAPTWVRDVILADAINDNALGLSHINGFGVEAFLAQHNLDVVWYNDSATGLGQAMVTPQAAGPLNPFPSDAVFYIFSPGSFVRLDGGTLDLGLVRDSTLNHTNDLELFMEQWVEVCFIGIESVALTVPVCGNGGAPAPAALFACP